MNILFKNIFHPGKSNIFSIFIKICKKKHESTFSSASALPVEIVIWKIVIKKNCLTALFLMNNMQNSFILVQSCDKRVQEMYTEDGVGVGW